MSHYFDDILHRHAGGMTPGVKSPMLSPNAPRLLRRSSTSRSLAARSDFSTNGDHDDEDDDEVGTGADAGPYGGGGGSENGDARRGSVNTALLNDPDRVKARQEADAHLHSYITQQLERVRLERGAAGYVEGDEFEATV